MATVKLTVSGGKTMQTLASDIRAIGRFNKREFHQKAGKLMVQRTRRAVKLEGRDIHGKPFRKLRPSTERSIRPKPRKGQKKITGTKVRGPGHILDDTGKMLKALKMTADDAKAVIEFAGEAGKIATYHNEGTKPYTITPKSASVLRIPVVFGGALKPPKSGAGRKSKVGVKDVVGVGQFAKRVKHPGLPKREFFGFARYAGRDDLRDIAKIAERMIAAEARRRQLLSGVA